MIESEADRTGKIGVVVKSMPLPLDFANTLTEKTDEQLYDVLSHEVDYVPEALAAARMEIQRRSLSPTRIAELETRSQAILVQETQAAQEPLSLALRLTNFVFAFGFIQMIVADNYRSRGYTRKAEDCWTWMWYGLAFWPAFWITFSIFGVVFSPGIVDLIISAALGLLAVRWFRRRREHVPARP